MGSILNDLLNDENEDENEGQYNVITNYDYPINVYYNKNIKERLDSLVANTSRIDSQVHNRGSIKPNSDDVSYNSLLIIQYLGGFYIRYE